MDFRETLRQLVEAMVDARLDKRLAELLIGQSERNRKAGRTPRLGWPKCPVCGKNAWPRGKGYCFEHAGRAGKGIRVKASGKAAKRPKAAATVKGKA